ncbi:hypothetical protein QW131_19285 [Roseibium salinum]|nr:hypothetical protein [Roseibium salinum]
MPKSEKAYGPLAEEIDRIGDHTHLREERVQRSGERIEQHHPGESHGNHRRNVGKQKQAAQETATGKGGVEKLGGKQPEHDSPARSEDRVIEGDPQHGPEFTRAEDPGEILEREFETGEHVVGIARDDGDAYLFRVVGCKERIGDGALEPQPVAPAGLDRPEHASQTVVLKAAAVRQAGNIEAFRHCVPQHDIADFLVLGRIAQPIFQRCAVARSLRVAAHPFVHQHGRRAQVAELNRLDADPEIGQQRTCNDHQNDGEGRQQHQIRQPHLTALHRPDALGRT